MPISFNAKLGILILTFASSILTFIVYLAPEGYNHNNVAFVTVFPSTIPGITAQLPVDGPTVVLGVFGMKFTLFIY
jgi:hypothetical protein